VTSIGNEFVQPQPQPVPEPGTLLLVGGAIGLLAASRSLRSRRRQGYEQRAARSSCQQTTAAQVSCTPTNDQRMIEPGARFPSGSCRAFGTLPSQSSRLDVLQLCAAMTSVTCSQCYVCGSTDLKSMPRKSVSSDAAASAGQSGT
jgi:hypothetical protein